MMVAMTCYFAIAIVPLSKCAPPDGKTEAKATTDSREATIGSREATIEKRQSTIGNRQSITSATPTSTIPRDPVHDGRCSRPWRQRLKRCRTPYPWPCPCPRCP